MSQTVIIKSNKYGIRLILDAAIAFEDLLHAVKLKFQESEKLFRNSKLAISFEGRQLSEDEEYQIIDTITSCTSMEILCIIDNDEQRALSMKQQIDFYCSNVEQQYEEALNDQGMFHKGTLRSGQLIESESNVTIIGDVNPGAKIVSGGNIIILGELKGNVHAGAYGNSDCFVFALKMNPIQIQIAEYIAKSPDKEKERRRLIRKTKEVNGEAQIAMARDGSIYIEPVSKKVLRDI